MRGRGVAERPETRALLLARVVFGESDLVVTLLSWADGKVSALARSAAATFGACSAQRCSARGCGSSVAWRP